MHLLKVFPKFLLYKKLTMVESQDSQNTVFPDKLPLNVALVEFHLVLGFGRLSNLAVTANEGTVCEALDSQDVQIKQKLIRIFEDPIIRFPYVGVRELPVLDRLFRVPFHEEIEVHCLESINVFVNC